jgi:hypothetical protein
MPFLAMWSLQLPLTTMIQEKAGSSFRNHLEQVTAAALRRNSRQAVRKLCESDASGQNGLVRSESSIKRICQQHNGT